MPITIRDATPDDEATIAEFNTRLAAETEDTILEPGSVGPGVVALLADPSKGRYWLAEIDGRPVGQIMVTFEWSDWRNGLLWWIQSVYVDSRARSQGVFKTLYRHVEALAQADPEVCGIRLYVERGNAQARKAYASLGLRMTDYRVMETLLPGDDGC